MKNVLNFFECTNTQLQEQLFLLDQVIAWMNTIDKRNHHHSKIMKSLYCIYNQKMIQELYKKYLQELEKIQRLTNNIYETFFFVLKFEKLI